MLLRGNSNPCLVSLEDTTSSYSVPMVVFDPDLLGPGMDEIPRTWRTQKRVDLPSSSEQLRVQHPSIQYRRLDPPGL